MSERLPHSRACGVMKHEHGTACSTDCPTCHGRALVTSHPIRLTSQPPGKYVAMMLIDSKPGNGYAVIEDDEGFRVWQVGSGVWDSPSGTLDTVAEALALASANAGWGPPKTHCDPDEFPAIRAANVQLMDARAAWEATATEFPENGVCPVCGTRYWKVITEGYSQIVSAEYEAEPFRIDGVIQYQADGEPVLDHAGAAIAASTDGWDDMSENGDFTYLSCGNFDFSCKMSDKVVWT